MKKIILSLMLLTPFFFSSCEDVKELTGSMEFTIDKESYSFPVATFVKDGDKTIITSSELTNTATITFKGKTTQTYPLGIGADLIEAILNINKLDKAENVFIYFPTGGLDDSFISLYGTLQITEYTSKTIVGTFTGFGITAKQAREGVEEIITNEKESFYRKIYSKSS